MLSIKSLVESLGVFERNKVPLELKILGLAFYIQLCKPQEGCQRPYPRSTESPRQQSGSGLESSARRYASILPRCLGG
jgi:hypothetical protein